jgi:hypothetical protein
VTGSSWEDIEAILDHKVSDTTLRTRRDEWIDAGVFDRLETEALAAYDRILTLDLEHVSIDGSLHKAPCGGEGTGKSPVDRAKLGWKWSVAVDAKGIPIIRTRLAAYGLVNRIDSPSGCAGSSKQPTQGGPTTANSAETPTAANDTATPRSVSLPPFSSSQDSSTTATDGAPTRHLPAEPLRVRRGPYRWRTL